ncbi:albumin-2-like [Trifolium pratense]|uniref:albumin-2-like n=1 Tax=Trifolium pratense TaxID=57577 RepID=UPI001E69325C|nr:albumin-2-like [Trifolium pratense]
MPNYFNIDAAFASSKTNECFVFVKDKYVVLNYAPGFKKKEIMTGPRKIVEGFPMLKDTIFENGIDCAFDTTRNNETFIFSGNQCVKTTAPQSTNARLLSGPMLITAMFPTLIGTGFENGIESSTRSINNDTTINLFKGDELVVFDMYSNSLVDRMKISAHYRIFVGTVFESGIDAAFNTHVKDEVIVFKGQYYAHYNIRTNQFLNGYIKRIHDYWPALHGILQ